MPRRALKSLSEARRLDPTLPIDILPCSATPSDGESRGPDRFFFLDRRMQSAPPPPTTATATATATIGQMTSIGQIKKQKDYYQTLGLEGDCAVEGGLQEALFAEEAFKAVSKASATRRAGKGYDLSGTRPTARHRNYLCLNVFLRCLGISSWRSMSCEVLSIQNFYMLRQAKKPPLSS